jgi:hypothetical protein
MPGAGLMYAAVLSPAVASQANHGRLHPVFLYSLDLKGILIPQFLEAACKPASRMFILLGS